MRSRFSWSERFSSGAWVFLWEVAVVLAAGLFALVVAAIVLAIV